jgi:hypothetical protein
LLPAKSAQVVEQKQVVAYKQKMETVTDEVHLIERCVRQAK